VVCRKGKKGAVYLNATALVKMQSSYKEISEEFHGFKKSTLLPL
jgi:hypothetical protein